MTTTIAPATYTVAVTVTVDSDGAVWATTPGDRHWPHPGRPIGRVERRGPAWWSLDRDGHDVGTPAFGHNSCEQAVGQLVRRLTYDR